MIKSKKIYEKKLAIVTGASEGIGASLVKNLLNNDYKVVALSRNINKLYELKQKHKKFKKELKVYSVNVTNSKSLNEISRRVQAPDLLILNAGIYEPVNIDNFDIKKFITQCNVNYLGVIKSFDAFIKKMLKNRSGTVLIMSSVAGWIGLPKASAYAPTKSALKLFAQSIRYDLLKYNVRVKLCSPGFVNTKAVKINDFYMPGLIEPDDAAKIIMKKIGNSNFEITFPWLFARIMKILSILPDKISFKIIELITLNAKK